MDCASLLSKVAIPVLWGRVFGGLSRFGGAGLDPARRVERTRSNLDGRQRY